MFVLYYSHYTDTVFAYTTKQQQQPCFIPKILGLAVVFAYAVNNCKLYIRLKFSLDIC